jgi:hypothetical protein
LNLASEISAHQISPDVALLVRGRSSWENIKARVSEGDLVEALNETRCLKGRRAAFLVFSY